MDIAEPLRRTSVTFQLISDQSIQRRKSVIMKRQAQVKKPNELETCDRLSQANHEEIEIKGTKGE